MAPVSNDLVIADDISITDLNFYVDATHSWVGDLAFTLERVDSATSTTPIDRPGVPASTFGCSGDNYDVTIDDEGTDGNVETTCLGAPPAIAGSLVGGDPANASLLTAYDGLSTMATWRLTVSDSAGGDTGALNEWCIEVPAPEVQPICQQPALTIPDSDPAGVSTTITVPAGGSLTDLDFSTNTTHTWVGDLIYTLEHVDTGTTVTLIDRPGVPSQHLRLLRQRHQRHHQRRGRGRRRGDHVSRRCADHRR